MDNDVIIPESLALGESLNTITTNVEASVIVEENDNLVNQNVIQKIDNEVIIPQAAAVVNKNEVVATTIAATPDTVTTCNTSVEAAVIIVENETTESEAPQPSQRVHKGLSFLLQQMRSTTTVQANKTAEETSSRKRQSEIISESAPPSKQIKPLENVWKVTEIQLENIQRSKKPEYCFENPQRLQTCIKSFESQKDRNNRYRFRTDNNYVRSVKWSPSGKFLLTDSADLRIRILPYADEKIDETKVESHCYGGLIYDQQWHPTMDIFASTSNGHPIQIFDTKFENKATARCINHLDELDSAYSLAFSNDGTRLYGGFRSSVYIFDLEKPSKQLYKIKTFDKKESIGQRAILSCMAMNPLYFGSYAVGSYNGTIGFYSDQTSKLDILFEATSPNVTHLRYSPDGNTLFYGCNKNNTIQSLDVRFGCKPLTTYNRPVNTSQKIYFEIDKSGKYLISGSTNNEILVFDLKKETEIEGIIEPTVRIADTSRVCAGLSLHPTESIIATSHGERIFPFPQMDESDSEDEERNSAVVIDYGVKLWKFF